MNERLHAGIASDLTTLREHVWHLLREIEHNALLDVFYRHETDEEKRQLQAEMDRTDRELHEALAVTINTIATRLLLYTEALSLPCTRAMVLAWQERWPEDKLATSSHWWDNEAYGRESKPFNELKLILDGILVLVRPENEPPPVPVDRRDHERLEYCLRALAKVCLDRGKVPENEHDVQQVLHSHLEGVFPDYTRSVTVSKPLMSFKPDGGIVSLKAAIECKFVASKAEIATAMHGLTEDLSGYAGSADWVHFYSVIYMTGAYANEGQVRQALGASGNAGAWTTILVTGTGARLPVASRGSGKKTSSTPAISSTPPAATGTSS